VRASLGLCCAGGAEPCVQDMQLRRTTSSLLYTVLPTAATGTQVMGPIELLGGMALPYFLTPLAVLRTAYCPKQGKTL